MSHCHKCVRVTVLCELLCQGGHSDLHKGDGNKHFVCDKIRGWKNLKVKRFFQAKLLIKLDIIFNLQDNTDSLGAKIDKAKIPMD